MLLDLRPPFRKLLMVGTGDLPFVLIDADDPDDRLSKGCVCASRKAPRRAPSGGGQADLISTRLSSMGRPFSASSAILSTRSSSCAFVSIRSSPRGEPVGELQIVAQALMPER